jgi:hypothetical protein
MIDFWTGEVDNPKLEVFDSESESDSDEDGSDPGEGMDAEEAAEADSAEASRQLNDMESAKSSAVSGSSVEGSSSKKRGSKKEKKGKKGKKKGEEEVVDDFTASDVTKLNGVTLSVVRVNPDTGEQSQAQEYNPGGVLFICLQVCYHFHRVYTLFFWHTFVCALVSVQYFTPFALCLTFS